MRLRFTPSSSAAFALLGLLLCGFSLSGPAAHAGSYGPPVISGGFCFSQYDDPNFPRSYFSWSNGLSGGTHGSGIKCWGDVRAVYTYSSSDPITDPAPPCIIVETAVAYWSGGSPSGSCSNGLGNLEHGGQSDGSRYSVVAPDASGVVKVTLSGAEARTDPAFDEAAVCHVNWWVNAYPITINLTGTTPDSSGGENILIGQRCSASLSCNAPGVTFSNFQWTVSGQVFGAFQVASDQSWGHASNLFTDPDWIRANPQWCWSKDENATISCSAQATINGTAIGTVTGQKQVKVWAPDYLFKPSSGPVSVGNIGNPLTLTLYAGGTATGLGSWDPPGAHNGGRVSTPNLFRPAGDGIWQFVQIIYPGRWEDWYDSLGFSHEASLNYDGQKLLDNAWPYPYGSPGLPWPADSIEGSGTSPTYWMEDSPSNPLDNSFYRYHIDESFDDFMMYQPPNSGNGSEWVPLHLYSWKWQADISQIGATWAVGWRPAPPGYVSNLSSARWTTHPEWQHILLNSGMHY